jgi:sugar phosphate permease
MNNTVDQDALYRKIAWRLLPLLMAAYFVCYLDRINLSFAQLQMKKDLPFSDSVFGVGMALTLLGYALFEVPSNALLERIGARKTLTRIMALWGLASVATMFVTTTAQFYVVRFLLGVFEAGFVPGVIVYLTYWFPASRRGIVVSTFLSAAVVANVVCGPLSGFTMEKLHGVNGWSGWQWVLLTQGMPAVVLAAVVFFVLQDRPQSAYWLSAQERYVNAKNLSNERSAATRLSTRAQLGRLLRAPRVLLLSLMTFCAMGGTYALIFWVPAIIKRTGVTDLTVLGQLSALPALCGVIGMILFGKSSDHFGGRRWHLLVACLIAAAGLLFSLVDTNSTMPLVASLCVAVFGISATIPLVVIAITDALSSRVVGIGLPLMTTIGFFGGAAASALTGVLNARTGSMDVSIVLVAGLFVVAGFVAVATLSGVRNNSIADQ